MKRSLATVILVLAGLALAAGAAFTPPGPRAGVFYAVYWVLGSAQSSDPKASVEGRQAVIYTPDAAGNVGTVYGWGYVTGGKFYINTFRTGNVTVGQTYKVAIPCGSDNYGADPVDLTISGVGFDRAPGLVLALGAGPGGVAGEQAPRIEMWFNKRLYQPAVYWVESSGNLPFVVAPQPEIRINLAIDAPYTLAGDVNAHQIVIDAGEAGSRTLTLTSANIASRTLAAGAAAEENKVSAMSLSYALAAGEALSSGKHTVSVTSRSSGLLGAAAAASQVATLEVLGGPLRLIGAVVVYPSPFNIIKSGNCEIQYTLSGDANIEIDIFSVEGKIVKRIRAARGAEGGAAGLNKVKWDGRTEMGTLAGNAVYVGTIIGRDENKLLGKFKFSVLN
ncbi:MAG: hypothetical protein JW873_06180 [Candidatus Saganbacteria bacterium]|nr:hypothetical protein [Candidatus Saganbacteria bacterium]